MTRVLVVDDEPQILRALRINLRARQYDVAVAATGAQALEQAAAHPPDLVILDLGLPDMSGIEVIGGLRGWTAVPIIVLSGRADSSDKVEALDAGADDYVTKPFGMDELLARMRAAVRRTPAAEAPPRIQLGSLTIDLAAKRVIRHGGPQAGLPDGTAANQAETSQPALDQARAGQAGTGQTGTGQTGVVGDEALPVAGAASDDAVGLGARDGHGNRADQGNRHGTVGQSAGLVADRVEAAETGQAETGQAEAGQAETGQAETGQAGTGQAETGQAGTGRTSVVGGGGRLTAAGIAGGTTDHAVDLGAGGGHGNRAGQGRGHGAVGELGSSLGGELGSSLGGELGSSLGGELGEVGGAGGEDRARSGEGAVVGGALPQGDGDVRLTPTEWHLLEVLLRNPGKLLSQRQLLNDVWGPGYDNAGGNLRLYMAQLRRKLEPDPARPRWLITEPGMGYRYQPAPGEQGAAELPI